MLDISFDEKKLNSLYKKLNMMANKLVANTEASLEVIMKNTQKEALNNKIGSKDENKIPYTVEKEAQDVIGKLRTNMPLNNGIYASYAPMIEFGTGKLGELAKLGKTKTFVESGYSYWYLPVEKAPRDFGASRKIMINDKEFYIMYSQSPHPFMRPAGFYLRNNASKLMSNSLREKLRKDL